MSLGSCTACCAFLLYSASRPSELSAGPFDRYYDWYTVDVDADVLVEVRIDTGHTQVVGPLGVDVNDVDLAGFGTGLYAVDNRPGEAAQLLWIDRDTGAATRRGTLTYGGQPVPVAEGLHGDWVSFGQTTASNSHLLGRLLTEDATISDVQVFPAETVDMDGLGAGSYMNELLALDAGSPGAPGGQFVLLTLDSGTALPWEDPEPGSPNDIALGSIPDFSWHSDFVHCAIEKNGTLYRISPYYEEVVETMTLDRPGNYHGLGTIAYYIIGGEEMDTVRSYWGQNVTPGNELHGDISGDGFVGGDDLDIVRALWAEGTPPSSLPVPEPAALVLLISVLACFVRRARPRRR